MTACEYSAMITGIACMLAKDKDAKEIALLASMFYQLAKTLETMSIYTVFCNEKEEEEKTEAKKVEEDKKQKDESDKEKYSIREFIDPITGELYFIPFS